MTTARYPRGSEWRQWDLHVHSPASFFWMGKRFEGAATDEVNIPIVDEMIAAFNKAEPAVFALMDYWNFDGWFALRKRLGQPGAPKLEKAVFPGIELRVAAPTPGRLNAHMIFSDRASDQDLRDFLSSMRLELIEKPVSEPALREYARKVGADKLKTHGFKAEEVGQDDDVALRAGYTIAELNFEHYRQAVTKLPEALAVGYMPFSTNDGLASVDQMKHYGFALSLFKASPVFETRDEGEWNAFVGRKTPANAKYFGAFQDALEGRPRLPVSGSDAHRFVGAAGDNDNRGYGDFPSGRRTWLKADPTWQGLLQAIKEPEKRCFIGATPPKLEKVASNKTYYMDRVRLRKVAGSPLDDVWFDGADIPLSHDLTAIIGNKGSGKSALADVIAVLGQSRDTSHFSFLRPDRFRGKAGEPARQFEGELVWLAGDPKAGNLADNPPADSVELIKYIPQGRFEALCNDHVSGRSDAFEKELRSVIFEHLGPARLNMLSFDALTEHQERGARAVLSEHRRGLAEINRLIANMERQLHPDIRGNLNAQLELRRLEMVELQAAKPGEVPPPATDPTEAQKAAAARLQEIAASTAAAAETERETQAQQVRLREKAQAIRNVREQLSVLESQVAHFEMSTRDDLAKLGLELSAILDWKVKREPLDRLAASSGEESAAVQQTLNRLKVERAALDTEAAALGEALNAPQRLYQAYLTALRDWEARKVALQGDAATPESIAGLEAQIAEIDGLPARLAAKASERRTIVAAIYAVLTDQRTARANLFEPLQKVIRENSLIRDEYHLQFEANLSASSEAVAETLFSMVKQSIGDLRGEDESYTAIRQRADAVSFNQAQGALDFVDAVAKLLEDSSRRSEPRGRGLTPIMRKDRHPAEVYDYLYGLEYLEPKYTLLFQDTPIEQLSPGQRGALLLIFYLLVDLGRNPILLDQPEENLDNETIVNLLVPVICEAKKNRQIVMVTHNPNLAVVCDAEQIIRASFDRKSRSTITYQSGSIEDGTINAQVVDVLEGTKPAFDNRSGKYR